MKTTDRKKIGVSTAPGTIADYPKYLIAELIRVQFGELRFNEGVNALFAYCRLQKKQTVKEWMRIPAGSPKKINPLVLPAVLEFFELNNEKQLLSRVHLNAIADDSECA